MRPVIVEELVLDGARPNAQASARLIVYSDGSFYLSVEDDFYDVQGTPEQAREVVRALVSALPPEPRT